MVGLGGFFAVFVVVVCVLVACPGSVLFSFCVNLRAFYLLSFVVGLVSILQLKLSVLKRL